MNYTLIHSILKYTWISDELHFSYYQFFLVYYIPYYYIPYYHEFSLQSEHSVH